MQRYSRTSILAGLCALSFVSCGDNRGAVRLQLQVHDSLRSRIKSLRITTRTRSRENELWQASTKAPSTVLQAADGAPHEVTVVVPANIRGQLLVGVNALDEAGAELASGRGVASIEGAADSSKLSPVAVPLTVPHCLPEGWCWSHPQPQGQHINSVFGTAADDLWAVGSGGAILHYDGIGWNGVPSPTTSQLFGIHGSGAQDIWAVGGGGGTTLHYDGTSWTAVANPSMQPLRAVWSVAPTSAWAAGAAGTVLRFDGSSWKDTSAPGGRSLYGVWAASADDVFVAGDGGAQRYRNGGWDPAFVSPPINPAPMSPPADLRSVWGSSATDVFFTGPAGALLHFNGGGFDSVNVISGFALNAISGKAADDLWIVGSNGSVLHRSGVASGAGAAMGWRTAESYTNSALSAIWAVRRDLAWAVGNDGALQRWDGQRFWNVPQRETAAMLFSIHAASNGSALWAVGERGTLLRWNGVQWEPTPIDTTDTVRDVFSDGPDRAWAVGSNGLLLRWDGQRWQRVDSGERVELTALFGVSADDLWAAGRSGVLLHFDGQRWQRSSAVQSADLVDLWGRSSSDVWAVGSSGTVIHWDGQSWQPAAQGVPMAQNLLSVWGTDTDLYAAGTNGTLLRREKESWQPIQTGLPTGTHFGGLWGRAADDIWLSGSDGRLYRFNGSVVTPQSIVVPADAAGMARPLGRLRGDAQGQLFVVGAQGTIVVSPAANTCAACSRSGRALSLNVTLDGFTGMTPIKRLSIDVLGAGKRLPGSPFDVSATRSPYTLGLPATVLGPLSVHVVAYGEGGVELGAGREQIELSLDPQRIEHSVRLRAGCSADGWCVVSSPTSANLTSVWGAAEDAIWAVGDGGSIVRWNGTTWLSEVSPTAAGLKSVWGTARDDVWAVGDAQGSTMTVLHRDTNVWQPVSAPLFRLIGLPLAGGTSSDRSNVHVVSPSDASLLQLAGGSWQYFPAHGRDYGCSQLAAVWGPSGAGSDVFAVGTTCALRSRAGTWSALPSPSSPLAAVWGSAADDVWAAGSSGVLYRWNGRGSSEVTPRPTTQSLRSLWGTAADDIWAVGQGDTILHFDGKTWAPKRSPTSGRGLILSGVWARSRSDAWIVGQGGTILRYQS